MKTTLRHLKKFMMGFGMGLLYTGGFLVCSVIFLMFVSFISPIVGDGMGVLVGMVFLLSILAGVANVFDITSI